VSAANTANVATCARRRSTNARRKAPQTARPSSRSSEYIRVSSAYVPTYGSSAISAPAATPGHAPNGASAQDATGTEPIAATADSAWVAAGADDPKSAIHTWSSR
jgi:hypothetical protein